MNDSAPTRIAVAAVAMAALVLLAAACSGGGPDSPNVARVAASVRPGTPLRYVVVAERVA